MKNHISSAAVNSGRKIRHKTSKRGETIPLGLLYLASSVRADGYPVKIIDAEILGLNIKAAAEKYFLKILELSALLP